MAKHFCAHGDTSGIGFGLFVSYTAAIINYFDLKKGWWQLWVAAGCAAGAAVVWFSCGEGADLDEVVGEDAVSAPDSGAVDAGEFGAVPAEAAFEVVDPPF
jgi:hypothetical protein